MKLSLLVLETVLIPIADGVKNPKLPQNVMEVLKTNYTAFDRERITTAVDDLVMAKTILQNALSIIEENEMKNKEYVLNSFKEIINEI